MWWLLEHFPEEWQSCKPGTRAEEAAERKTDLVIQWKAVQIRSRSSQKSLLRDNSTVCTQQIAVDDTTCAGSVGAEGALGTYSGGSIACDVDQLEHHSYCSSFSAKRMGSTLSQHSGVDPGLNAWPDYHVALIAQQEFFSNTVGVSGHTAKLESKIIGGEHQNHRECMWITDE